MAIASFIPGVGAPFVLVGGAIFLGVEGQIPTAIGLALCVVAYLAFGIIGGRDFYELIEWNVIRLPSWELFAR